MSTKPHSDLVADETAQQRTQAEQFTYNVKAPGMVDVTNESHENPAEHHSVVSIDE